MNGPANIVLTNDEPYANTISVLLCFLDASSGSCLKILTALVKIQSKADSLSLKNNLLHFFHKMSSQDEDKYLENLWRPRQSSM